MTAPAEQQTKNLEAEGAARKDRVSNFATLAAGIVSLVTILTAIVAFSMQAGRMQSELAQARSDIAALKVTVQALKDRPIASGDPVKVACATLMLRMAENPGQGPNIVKAGNFGRCNPPKPASMPTSKP